LDNSKIIGLLFFFKGASLKMVIQPIRLIPEYRDYVWGGDRLRPEIVPTAEAWVVYEGNRVASGPFAGRTLADLAAEFGAAILGKRAVENTGNRFPVLIKILDCAQWLSLQVHPDDKQAVALEGYGFFGKTEAWQVLEALPGSKLIAGMKPGVSADLLADAIRHGTIVEIVETLDVKECDTIFMSPGTIHALGPGLLIYEIQQTSDLTYRVYDWGRPQTETRKLHIDKAIAVSRPDATADIVHSTLPADGNVSLLSQCEYFRLEMIVARENTVELDTQGESFHTLTLVKGQSEIILVNESQLLNPFETLLIPAQAGHYIIRPIRDSQILKAEI
jgi:mannose-6-phosphate isomerase